MNNQRVGYLLNSAINYFTPKKCPSCGTIGGKVIDRKFLVTRLICCKTCHLNYRHPLDAADFNKKFYNTSYTESDGITTELPNEKLLEQWLREGFAGSAKDMRHHIAVIESLCGDLKELKIVDYGANWGYGSYQFKQKGMIVDSYELATARAEFGKKLNIDIKTEESKITSNNDIFYSSHVIEHLPSIPKMLALARRSLSKDGYFIAFCPNGSNEFRSLHHHNFHRAWGLVHPNYLSADYYRYIFKDNPYYISSNPYALKAISQLQNQQLIGDLRGEELMVISKINTPLDK